MPSKSPEQAKLMQAACHNKEFAKKVNVSQDVACEFNKADTKKVKEDEEINTQSIKNSDSVDTITMDVPLFIRFLEFAREDASTDMDLHVLAEHCVEISKEHSMTMGDYDQAIEGTKTKESDVVTKENALGIFKESILKLSKYGI